MGKLVLKLPAGIVTEFVAGSAIADGSLQVSATTAPPAGARMLTFTLPDAFAARAVGVVRVSGGDA